MPGTSACAPFVIDALILVFIVGAVFCFDCIPSFPPVLVLVGYIAIFVFYVMLLIEDYKKQFKASNEIDFRKRQELILYLFSVGQTQVYGTLVHALIDVRPLQHAALLHLGTISILAHSRNTSTLTPTN